LDRQIVGIGQIPLDTDLLSTNKNTMLAIGELARAIFGSGGIVRGLTVAPQTVPNLTISVAPGAIYQLANVDGTPYGSLPADTTDTCIKQGIQVGSVNLSCPAPTTAGFSISYLIEAALSEIDTNLQLLPYYNASNPQQPYSGPNNTGAQTATTRACQVGLIAKAGVAAATGTQVPPSADPGFIALAVVTVANGQAQITSSSIVAKSAGVLPSDLFHAIQNNSLTYAKDTGAVNALAVSIQPSPSALLDGMVVEAQVSVTNTGAATMNLNGIGASPILGGAHLPLQGGELVAGGKAELMWHAGLTSWVLLGCTGGASQVGTAAKSLHAAQLGQLTGLIGSIRNGFMSIPAASSTGTFTADGICVASALNGIQYLLAGYNQSLNLATTGAGGMDVGAAPVSGFVAIYAIYNPVTNASSILATNSTSTVAPTVYGGANMPAGFTASALISVWQTNASGQLNVGYQNDRHIAVASVIAGTFTTALTNVAVTLPVPMNAKTVDLGIAQTTSTPATSYSVAIGASSPVVGGLASLTQNFSTSTATLLHSSSIGTTYMLTPQVIFCTWQIIGGSSPNLQIAVGGYSI
jgi:hypothetical protein